MDALLSARQRRIVLDAARIRACRSGMLAVFLPAIIQLIALAEMTSVRYGKTKAIAQSIVQTGDILV